MSRRGDDPIEEYLAGLLGEPEAVYGKSNTDIEKSGGSSELAPTDRKGHQPSSSRKAVALAVDDPALTAVERQRLQRMLAAGIPINAPVAESTAALTSAPRIRVARTVTTDAAGSGGASFTNGTVNNDVEVAESRADIWEPNGRPVWAQSRFDVLLVRVNSLTLAVPLIALGQIYKLDKKLTPLFGKTDWFMGLFPVKGKNISVLNTALYVMPEHYTAQWLERAKLLVTIDGCDWGLAVDEVTQPTKIEPTDVTWRGRRSKRPWLAGTIKSAMCALLDIPTMRALLAENTP